MDGIHDLGGTRLAAALTKLMADKSLCLSGDLAQREEALAARPHGHDH